MDFSKRQFNLLGSEERNVRRKLNVEESNRTWGQLPRAPEPSRRTGVRSPSSALIQRRGSHVSSTASISRSPPSEQISLKPTLFACSAMLAIAVGVFVGITIFGVDIEQVALSDLSVTHRLAHLIGASEDALKHGEAAAVLNDPTAQAQPSQPFSQEQATEPAALADHPRSSEIAPSSAEPLRSTVLTQPAVAAPGDGQISSFGKNENVSPPSYQGASVAASAQLLLPPIMAPDEKNSELYRQYLAWRDKDEMPQTENRPRRSFKRVASAYASPNHRVRGSRSGVSSGTTENLALTNPKDQKDLVRHSAR